MRYRGFNIHKYFSSFILFHTNIPSCMGTSITDESIECVYVHTTEIYNLEILWLNIISPCVYNSPHYGTAIVSVHNRSALDIIYSIRSSTVVIVEPIVSLFHFKYYIREPSHMYIIY